MKHENKFQGVVTVSINKDMEKDGKSYKAWTAVLEETDEQYPQSIVAEYFTNKDNAIPQPKEGDEIIVHYNLKAKEYQGRYFGANNVWRTEMVKAADGTSVNDMPVQSGTPMPSDTSDPLPF